MPFGASGLVHLNGSIDLFFVGVERVLEALKYDLRKYFLSISACAWFGQQMTVGDACHHR